MLTKVTDNKRDDRATTNVDWLINYINWNLHQKRTTQIWKILLERKYGSVDYVTLNDLKQSNTVELSEYYIANNISEKPDL